MLMKREQLSVDKRLRVGGGVVPPRLVLQNDVSRYKLAISLISERLWRRMLAQSSEDLQRMNDTRKIPEAGEQDVDQ
jgi:hypothetical protein